MLGWQACRATSAATTFFEPMVINGTRYSDGGLLYNNPMGCLHEEASGVFDNFDEDKTMIISLGTGMVSPEEFTGALLTIGEDLAAIATETQRFADQFYRRNKAKAALNNLYFRFNVPGLGDVGLDEAENLDKVKHWTNQYLNNSETSIKVIKAVERLSQSESVREIVAEDFPQLPRLLDLQARFDSLRSPEEKKVD